MKTFGKKPKPFEAVAKSAQPLVSDLKKFLASKVRDFEPEIRNAARDCISSRGKLIRPLLVFVSARGAKCDPSSLVRRAAIAELIHISSLVHDDIIDGADIRRNRETPNKKFGIKTAVLLGDAIFAHTMLLAFQEC